MQRGSLDTRSNKLVNLARGSAAVHLSGVARRLRAKRSTQELHASRRVARVVVLRVSSEGIDDGQSVSGVERGAARRVS